MNRSHLLWELVILVRLLYPRTITKNPRRKLLERATKNHKELTELAEELAEAIAKLNQCYRLRKGITIIETSREDNLNALALLVEQLNPESFWYKGIVETYRMVQRYYQDKPFTSNGLRKQTGIPKTTLHHHIKVLMDYGIIKQEGKNQTQGYTYSLINN